MTMSKKVFSVISINTILMSLVLFVGAYNLPMEELDMGWQIKVLRYWVMVSLVLVIIIHALATFMDFSGTKEISVRTDDARTRDEGSRVAENKG